MTPTQARDIYHAARLKAMQECVTYSQPVNQEACDLAGWKAVIEAIEAQLTNPPAASRNITN